ncbi:hypothetical protein V1358_12765 [Pseudoalteromonas sp. YIC-656]|uniref:DUF6916 family protein n=1 Tax=Pseudoalteromonas pernae TaxID=3118054 RepID=UPI003241C733
MIDNYNFSNLSTILGETVLLKDQAGNQVNLVVSEVIKGPIDGEQWEAFSVIYKGTHDFSVPQGIYKISHDTFGEKELFLSPNSQTEYETVVARKRDSIPDIAAL